MQTALESGKLFFVTSPAGGRYYPAFFADDRYGRNALSEASQRLRELPGPSKYCFFASKLHTLGQTPLEALAEGRLAKVFDSAAGFYER